MSLSLYAVTVSNVRSILSNPLEKAGSQQFDRIVPYSSQFKIMSKQAIHSLHQGLSKGLLPRSSQLHSHIKNFLGQEVNSLESINRENDKVLDELRDQWEQYNRVISALKAQKTKDHKFVEGSTNYLKVKEDEIDAKKKILDSISTGLKETVTKVKPLKLAELPYSKEPILKEMFLALFTALYDEPENKFEWEKFRKLGLLHYNGEDFVTRLANINFRDMPEEQYHNLLKLRNDEQFKEVCENSAYAYDIVDLADWVDYVCEGQKISIEKKQCERDYDKIKADKEKRGGKSMQLKEDFINEALTDIDKYQNNLMNLQSELRTLMIGMKSSIQDIQELDTKRAQQINELNRN